MEHLEPLRNRIRKAPIGTPPAPWKNVTVFAIGGLTEIGYADDSDQLLSISSTGRGLFDCLSGKRLARDYTEPDESWYDETRLRAFGIGPLESKIIRLSGLHGGGLLRFGINGWSLECLTIDWPMHSLVLVEPYQSIYDDKTSFTKISVESELRAFGFSDTGKSFVIATSSDLYIYAYLD